MFSSIVEVSILGIAEGFYPEMENPIDVWDLFFLEEHKRFGLEAWIGSTLDSTYIGSASERAIINYASKLEEEYGLEAFTFIMRISFPGEQQCYTWPRLSVQDVIEALNKE